MARRTGKVTIHHRRYHASPSLVGLLLLLCSCRAVPVPADQAELVGVWEATQPVAMRLIVTGEGWMWYRKIDGNVTTTVRGPITQYREDAFVVGVWFITTTFHVHRPPFRDGAAWKMVVDSVELERTPDPPVIPADDPPTELDRW